MKNPVLGIMRLLGLPTSGLAFRFMKDTSVISAANILQSLFSYFIIVLLSRNLGAEGFGQYSFIFSFAALFFIFADLGMSTLLVKEFPSSKKGQEKYLSNIISFKILLGMGVFLVFAVASFLTGKRELLLAMIVAGVVQLLSSIALTMSSLLRVKNDAKTMSYAIVIERLIVLVGAIILLPLTKSLDHFVMLMAVAMLFYAVYLINVVRRYFRYRFTIDWAFLKGYLKRSLPFFGVKVFSMVYIRIDTVMLSLMVSDIVVGWYNAPYKIVDLLNLFPSLLLVFGFPLFSRLQKRRSAAGRRLFVALLFASFSFALPIIVGVWFVGDRVLEFIYRFGSIESFVAFKILIIAQLFISLSIIMGYFIAAAEDQKIFAWISGVGAAFNLLLNFILIPRYSLYGAGIATLLTYVLLVAAMYVIIRRKMGVAVPLRLLFTPLLAAIIMGLVTASILHLHVLLIILASGMVYAGVFLALELLFRNWSRYLLPQKT